MREIYRAACLVLILLSIVWIPELSRAQAEWFIVTSVSWGVEAAPGDLNDPLIVYIQYTGTTNLVSLMGALNLPSAFKSSNGSSVAYAYNGPTPAGSIVPLTFYISIDPRASIGAYTAELSVSGKTIYGAVIEQSLNISIDLRGRADLVFEASPRTLVPGAVNNISIEVFNRGSGPAYNITLSYSLQGQGSVLSTPPPPIPIIPPGSSSEARLQIYIPPSAALQPLAIAITATYVNPYYSQRSLSQLLGLYIGQQPLAMISITPLNQSLTAGAFNNVVIKVANIGSSKISNLLLFLSIPQQVGIIGGDGRLWIGDLDPLSYKIASFSLYISPQAPQVIYIQVQSSYTDASGVQRTDTAMLGFQVEATPGSFQILGSYWGSPQQPSQAGPGDSGVVLVILVRYVSNSTAYNVNFTLTTPRGINILPSPQSASQYVPSIQPNSVVQLSYQVGIDQSVAIGVYRATLSISWDTQTGRGYGQGLEVMIDIRGRADISIYPLSQALEPGALNTLRLLFVNNGTGAARQVMISSIQAASASIVDYQPRQFDLMPGEGRVVNVTVYMPPSMQQSPISLTISLTYIDPYGFPRSYTQQVGLYSSAQKMPSILVEPLTASLVPGYINNVTLRITNIGGLDIYNLSASLSVQVQGAASLTPPQLVGYLGSGRSSILSYEVYVPPSLAASTLVASISISYVDQYGSQRSYTQQIGFYVLETGLSMISVNVSSTTIQPGFNNISIYVVNNGNTPVYNLTLYITPTQPLALVNSDGRYYVGNLESGGSWTSQVVIYTSRPAATPQQVNSTADLKITLTYYDSSGALRSESRDIYLIIYTPPVISPIAVDIDPKILVAGKINNATIHIRNTGQKAVENLQVSITASGGASIIGASSLQVQRLSPGSLLEVPLEIYVPPSASPSAVLQLDLGYYIEGSLFQESRGIGVVSRGIIDIRVTDYTSIPEIPAPGQVFSITVTITNQGTITASAVTATPLPMQGIRVFGSRSVFIGDMQVNSPSTFTITFITSNTTPPGRYEIPIQLTYYDNLRTLYTVNISIPIVIGVNMLPTTTRAPQQGSMLEAAGQWIYSAAIAVIAAVIALALGIYIGRRGRK